MAKVTYYLGAGASFHSCPILDKQAEMMLAIAKYELTEIDKFQKNKLTYKFLYEERDYLPENNKKKILWYMGYFGKQALKYNTIDTYARKLYLTDELKELHLLKMCVSVFFDIWENFFDKELKFIDSIENYTSIDKRYISLFSILLDKKDGKIKLNDSFKFISWNYDLQLESAFKSFIKNDQIHFQKLNDSYLKFLGDNKIENDVFHLNGHRGFYNAVSENESKKI